MANPDYEQMNTCIDTNLLNERSAGELCLTRGITTRKHRAPWMSKP